MKCRIMLLMLVQSLLLFKYMSMMEFDGQDLDVKDLPKTGIF